VPQSPGLEKYPGVLVALLAAALASRLVNAYVASPLLQADGFSCQSLTVTPHSREHHGPADRPVPHRSGSDMEGLASFRSFVCGVRRANEQAQFSVRGEILAGPVGEGNGEEGDSTELQHGSGAGERKRLSPTPDRRDGHRPARRYLDVFPTATSHLCT
jgi:hypothetical protein